MRAAGCHSGPAAACLQCAGTGCLGAHCQASRRRGCRHALTWQGCSSWRSGSPLLHQGADETGSVCSVQTLLILCSRVALRVAEVGTNARVLLPARTCNTLFIFTPVCWIVWQFSSRASRCVTPHHRWPMHRSPIPDRALSSLACPERKPLCRSRRCQGWERQKTAAP